MRPLEPDSRCLVRVQPQMKTAEGGLMKVSIDSSEGKAARAAYKQDVCSCLEIMKFGAPLPC